MYEKKTTTGGIFDLLNACKPLSMPQTIYIRLMSVNSENDLSISVCLFVHLLKSGIFANRYHPIKIEHR